MYFNRYDIIEAHYWFYANHHEGQWSPEYARMCRIARYFQPGAHHNGPTTKNAQAIYAALKAAARRGEPPPPPPLNRIRALRTEAGAAGDYEQVRLCDEALAGNLSALEQCADVLAEAEAER